MSFSSPRRQRTGPIMPITNMVDVMLLLLIFFVTVSVFRQEDRAIPVALPASETTVTGTAVMPLIITVTSDGGIHMGKRTLDIPQLRQTLKDISRDYPDEAVLIRGDSDSRHGRMLEVLDLVFAHGFRNVTFATSRKDRPS